MKLFTILTMIGLITHQPHAKAGALCSYQRFSFIYGGILQIYSDSNCYVAQNYCEDAARASPQDPDAGGSSEGCKTLEQPITSGSASFTLRYRGVNQQSFYATRFSTTGGAQYIAEIAARNRCNLERQHRASSSADTDYFMNSSCDQKE